MNKIYCEICEEEILPDEPCIEYGGTIFLAPEGHAHLWCSIEEGDREFFDSDRELHED